MDPQPRPPRSALLAALRNNGITEELRGIGYAVDLQGNWLADSLIFTTDRLEGNLDNLPLAPRQILERRAAAYMSNAPARPSYVPARSISRPLSSNRPSATSTWGCPSPDPHLLPRPGTDAWYEYKFGPTATPTPAPMSSLSFADSSVVASLEEYHDDDDDRDDTADKDNDEGIEREDEDGHDWLILSTVPPTPAPLSAPSATLADSSVITSPAEYQDDYEDEEDKEDENEEDDVEGHYEDDTHTQISATVMWDRQPANPFVSPARVFAPAPPAPAPGTARVLAPTPTPSQTAPVPASSVVSVGEQYQDEDKDGRDDTGPLAFPAPLSAPAPTASVPAPNVGVPAPAPATAGSYPTLAPVSALTIRFRYDAFALAKKCETQIMKKITKKEKRVVKVLLD
ncbi:hypothetical protein K4K56_001023 [Colletotrichum sp. SAR 10_98]|nr:hypothetical protein K4K56_001023 [Colletotrichum sp. SAR 10_98]